MISFLVVLSIVAGVGLGLLSVLVAGPCAEALGINGQPFSLYPRMGMGARLMIGLWILAIAVAFFRRIRFTPDAGYNIISDPIAFFSGAFRVIGTTALILAVARLVLILLG